MYGIHPHHTAPHRTNWILNVSLWLQRNTVINADAKICKFLEMLIGFNSSDWDA